MWFGTQVLRFGSLAISMVLSACVDHGQAGFSPSRRPPVVSPTSLLAIGLNGALIVSQDGGATWRASPTAPADAILRSLVRVDRMVLVAVGAKGRIIRSVDDGREWQEVAAGVTDRHLLMTMGLGQGVVLASGERGQILRSEDGGAQWRVVAHQLGPWPIRLLSLDERGRLRATADDGTTWQSEDLGKTWGAPQFASCLAGLIDCRGDEDRLLDRAQIVANGVQRSDVSMAWPASAPCHAPCALWQVLATGEGKVLAIAVTGDMASSGDGGRSWQPIFGEDARRGIERKLATPAGAMVPLHASR